MLFVKKQEIAKNLNNLKAIFDKILKKICNINLLISLDILNVTLVIRLIYCFSSSSILVVFITYLISGEG